MMMQNLEWTFRNRIQEWFRSTAIVMDAYPYTPWYKEIVLITLCLWSFVAPDTGKWHWAINEFVGNT